MIIHTDTFIPYEFKSREDCLKYVIKRCLDIKKSLRFIEKTTERLYVRCPVVGDYLEITGTDSELDWIHNKLIIGQWYRPI